MIRVSVPASSANLGPGYDVLALALDLRTEVVARPADAWSITHHDGPAPAPGADAVLSGARSAVPSGRPLALDVRSAIPRGRGLGSSAAAYLAGAAVAVVAAGRTDLEQAYEVAVALEGHPDNVAAAFEGGLVAVVGGSRRRLDLWPGWRFLVAIPDTPLATSEARSVVPRSLPTAVVSRSLARTIALLEGLRTGDADLLRRAHGDEIHEGPRSSLSPRTEAVIAAAREAGAAHACWSGAGPTVLAVVTEAAYEDVSTAMKAALGPGEVRELPVAAEGLRVEG